MVLFLSAFGAYKLPKAQNKYTVFGRDNNQYLDWMSRTRQTTLEWFTQACRRYPDVSFVYRPHPVETSDETLMKIEREFPNFFVIGGHAVKHWINAANLVYLWNSTTLAEVHAAGKPCYAICPHPHKGGTVHVLFEDARYITDLQSFLKSLEKGNPADFPISDATLRYFCESGDIAAFRKVCGVLLEELQKARRQKHKASAQTQLKALFDPATVEANMLLQEKRRVKRLPLGQRLYQYADHGAYGRFVSFLARKTSAKWPVLERRRVFLDAKKKREEEYQRTVEAQAAVLLAEKLHEENAPDAQEERARNEAFIEKQIVANYASDGEINDIMDKLSKML
jgi:hypothetical protein